MVDRFYVFALTNGPFSALDRARCWNDISPLCYGAWSPWKRELYHCHHRRRLGDRSSSRRRMILRRRNRKRNWTKRTRRAIRDLTWATTRAVSTLYAVFSRSNAPHQLATCMRTCSLLLLLSNVVCVGMGVFFILYLMSGGFLFCCASYLFLLYIVRDTSYKMC